MTADQMPITADATDPAGRLLFTMGLTLLTTLVFGLLPAIVAGGGDRSALKDDSTRGTTGERPGRFGQALVIAETALAVVLVDRRGPARRQLHARDAR